MDSESAKSEFSLLTSNHFGFRESFQAVSNQEMYATKKALPVARQRQVRKIADLHRSEVGLTGFTSTPEDAMLLYVDNFI